MECNKEYGEHLERIMNQLADSVLELSDEAIFTETAETGADPQEEAERTRLVLRQASNTLQAISKRLLNLGHTINPKYGRYVEGIYHNECLSCGSSVSFTMATNELQGNALSGRCPENGYAMQTSKASGN